MSSMMKTISMSMIFLTFLVACDSKIYELTFKRAHARPGHLTAPKVRPFKVKSSFQCLEMCAYILINPFLGRLCSYLGTISMQCECLIWDEFDQAGDAIGPSETAWCSTELIKCQPWARWGECEKNAGYMLAKCRFACVYFADPSYDKDCMWKSIYAGPLYPNYSILDVCKRT